MKGEEKIIGLDSELDKLRNKELAFGCIITDKCRFEDDYETCIYVTSISPDCVVKYCYLSSYKEPIIVEGQFRQGGGRSIIGHPLTWGRIILLHRQAGFIRSFDKTPQGIETMHNLSILFNEINYYFEMYMFYDQNELQWMQNKKAREKLQPLLKQFSDYL